MEEIVKGGNPSRMVGRRGFLKGAALGGCVLAGAGMTGLVACSPSEEPAGEEENLAGTGENAPGYIYEAEQAEGEWFYNACPRNCFDTCAIMTKVVDGKIVQVKGNPDNTFTRGGLCVKTQQYIDWTYNADRILYPMKRTGAKGPGCTFERISWDEAVQIITDKWKEIIATDGPEAIAPNYFSGSMGFIQGDFWPAIVTLFRRMGTTHLMPGKCSNSKGRGFYYSMGHYAGCDPERTAETDLFIDWGMNAPATSPHFPKYLKELKKNGGKIVVVNPVRIQLCDWADMHIQLKAGTDSAFCLGVSNEIINNGWADMDFIEKHTTGFDEYKAAAAEWTLAKTAETCGITEQEIKDFAKLYATTEKSILRSGVQPCRRLNGGMIMFSISLLPALIGHIGKHPADGMMADTSPYWAFNQPAIAGTQFQEGAQPADSGDPGTLKVRYYANSQFAALLNGIDVEVNGAKQNFSAPLVKSVYIFNANTIASDPDTNLLRKGLSREDLFTVVHDVQMTQTAEYADIILPAPTHFEGEEIDQAYGSLWLVHNEQAIEPLGEAKNNWEVACLLAKAMGYTDPEFDLTVSDLAQQLMDTAAENPYLNGLTYDKLKEIHQFKLEVGTPRAADLETGFPTPTGKIQFVSEELEQFFGVRTSTFTPDRESLEGDPELLAKYPLNVLTNAPKEYLNGCFGNMGNNNALFEVPLVYLHPEDAADRGIKDGDTVRIFNDRGEVTRVARIVDGFVAKGNPQVYKGTWDNYADVANVNALTLCDVTDMAFCTPYVSTLVEIEKA